MKYVCDNCGHVVLTAIVRPCHEGNMIVHYRDTLATAAMAGRIDVVSEALRVSFLANQILGHA